jgi:hypothetical protein
MSLILAPVLQDVAARVSGQEPEQRLRAPDRWAYAVRDAAALARPDWVVTHVDPGLEAAALAGLDLAPDDLLDADLPATPEGAAVLTLTEILAALHPHGVVAASITGPVTIARQLAGPDPVPADALETAALDCGDVLAALAAALLGRGAREIVVWESAAGDLAPGALADVHAPILRRLGLAEAGGLITGPEAVRHAGYARWAAPTGGEGAALIEPAAFAGRATLAEALASAAATAGAGGVLLSHGPVPGDCDLAALGALAEIRDDHEGGTP